MRGVKQNVWNSLLPPKVQSLYTLTQYMYQNFTTRYKYAVIVHAWSEAKREDLLASTEGNTVICHCHSPLPNRVWHGLLVYIYKRDLFVCL